MSEITQKGQAGTGHAPAPQFYQRTIPTHAQARFSGKHCVVASIRDDAAIISSLYDTAEQAQAAQAALKAEQPGALVAYWPTPVDLDQMRREDESEGFVGVARVVGHSIERRIFARARAKSPKEAIGIAEAQGFEPLPVSEGGDHYLDPHTVPRPGCTWLLCGRAWPGLSRRSAKVPRCLWPSPEPMKPKSRSATGTDT